MAEKVTMQKQDRIAVVTINNPPVNALNEQVLTELDQTVEALAADQDLLAVVLTGAGERAFVAGADISRFPELRREGGFKLARAGQVIFQKIADLPCPVICAVNGFALGGGIELALACDIRVVAENAKLGVPEITLGVIPGYGGTQRLPRFLAPGKAKELIFTGEMIDAAEAHRLGIADRLTAKGESLAEALKLAAVIASRAPVAVRVAKKVVNAGIEMKLQDALVLEAEGFGDLCETEDKNEGAKAFFEKRPPNFTGK